MDIKEQNTTETYTIAKTWKRITARIFDVILVSVIPLVIGLIIYYSNHKNNQEWWKLIVVAIINIITIIIYFIIIPWKCNGQTFGKLILQIKLIKETNKQLMLKELFYRELFLIFIPLLLTMTIILVMRLTFNENIVNIESNSTLNSWLSILIRVIVSFDFAWYCGIMIVTKIDKFHQLFYDRRAKIYVTNKKPETQKIKKIQTNSNELHIHLVYSQPGNISDNELESIHSL